MQQAIVIEFFNGQGGPPFFDRGEVVYAERQANGLFTVSKHPDDFSVANTVVDVPGKCLEFGPAVEVK